MTTRRSQRLAGAFGLASVPLLIAGALLIGLPIPGEDEPGREYVNYFTEDDGQIWLGAMLTFLGLIAFLVFLTGLRGLLRRAEPERGGLSGLVLAAGTATALFELVGVTILAGTAGSTEFFEGVTLDPDTAQLMLGMSWLPSIYAGLAATVVVAATSLSARRTGALPRAFARAGFVVAPVMLVASVVGFTDVLLPLWVIAAGSLLILRSGAEARPDTAYDQPPAGVPA